MIAEESAGEIDDFGVFRRNAARVVLADGRNRRLGHALAPRAAGLSAPDIDRFKLAGDGHRGEHASPHVERALEAHEGAEMGDTASQLRTVEKHRKRPLNGATALGD